MAILTFDQLPIAVSLLTKEISELKRLLIEKQQQPLTPQNNLLTVQGAGSLLNLSVPTIYSKVSRGELPFMKRGKRLYFSHSELMEYLEAGRKKSNAEIEQEVDAYLSIRKK